MRNQLAWDRHVEENQIKPYDGPFPLMNDNKPCDGGGFLRAVGPWIAEVGVNFMAGNPGNAYLRG